MLTPDLIINQCVKQLSPWLLIGSEWAASAAKGSRVPAQEHSATACPRAEKRSPSPSSGSWHGPALTHGGDSAWGSHTITPAKGEEDRNMFMTTGSGTGWAGPLLSLAVQAPEAALPQLPHGHPKRPSPARTHQHHPHYFPPETQEYC